jgi:Tol biopolymer transport system component
MFCHMRVHSALLLLLLCANFSNAESPKLLISFASYRDRPKQPTVYFYEHDGVANGKIVGKIDTANLRSDHHPSLSHDGRYCSFASELENQAGKISVWDLKEKKLVEMPKLNDSPNAQMHPSFSGDGKFIAFAAWNRPMAGTRWQVLLYDVAEKKLADVPGLNQGSFDHRTPALSGDGKFIAYSTNSRDGVGQTDVFLFDRDAKKVLPLPEMNSKNMDVEPSLSRDGSLVAFASDRPGGAGSRDIYLFDRAAKKFLPLPGLNSAAHEQSPALSPDGRYIVFVSERVRGEGERDIYLYDRSAGKLLSTPGLNSKAEDIDPCIIVLP